MSLDSATLRARQSAARFEEAALSAAVARLRAEIEGSESVLFDAFPLLRDPAFGDLVLLEREVLLGNQDSQRSSSQATLERQRQVRTEITALQAQKVSVAERLRLVQADITEYENLRHQGPVTRRRLSAWRKELAELHGREGEITANMAAQQARHAEIDLEWQRTQASYRSSLSADLKDTLSSLYDIREERSRIINDIAQLDVSAPISGKVNALSVAGANSVVMPGEPILEIVPMEGRSMVLAYADSSERLEIHEGQFVEVEGTGISGRTGGTADGEVARISAYTVPHPTDRSDVFEVEIILDDRSTSQEVPPRFEPGSAVILKVRTRDYTPMSYLLSPLTSYFSHALRGG